MRTDVFHFYNAPIETVYNAYKCAIQEKFGKTPECTPYCTLTFSLGFSFKYNMNGGTCHVNLMPYNQGTAVDIRYTIVQALGARCNKHDSDMTSKVESILKMSAQDVQLNVDDFLNYKNQAHTTPTQVGGNNTKPTAKFCANCGAEFGETDLFCKHCGTKRS